jgi:hypothetical protein
MCLVGYKYRLFWLDFSLKYTINWTAVAIIVSQGFFFFFFLCVCACVYLFCSMHVFSDAG